MLNIDTKGTVIDPNRRLSLTQLTSCMSNFNPSTDAMTEKRSRTFHIDLIRKRKLSVIAKRKQRCENWFNY